MGRFKDNIKEPLRRLDADAPPEPEFDKITWDDVAGKRVLPRKIPWGRVDGKTINDWKLGAGIGDVGDGLSAGAPIGHTHGLGDLLATLSDIFLVENVVFDESTGQIKQTKRMFSELVSSSISGPQTTVVATGVEECPSE